MKSKLKLSIKNLLWLLERCLILNLNNNDYSVCVTAVIINNIAYIIDIYKCRLEFPNLLEEIKTDNIK